MKQNPPIPIFYLPLERFHIIPIDKLDPLSIKASAKKAKCDREKIKYNSLLNAIAKALGIKGGIARYQHTYDTELVPFLNKHGMRKRANLLKQTKKGFDTFLTDITHQELSERLFFSGWDLPNKIFTGYNFDYEHTIDDGDDYFNRVIFSPFQYEISGQVGPFNLKKNPTYNGDFTDIQKIVEHNIKIANENATIIHDCPYDKKPLKNIFDTNQKKHQPDAESSKAGVERYKCFANRTVLDLVVGSFIKDLGLSFNLLGDSLVEPVHRSQRIELYPGNGDKASLNKSKELAMAKFYLFRKRIELGSEGWVDVIPFNKNLVFLKGKNGQYDFVFKNQRDKEFEHQIFGESLKRADIPSFIPDYQFLRWHYFEYQGWRKLNRHNSENYFYKRGNKTNAYPGCDVILRDYHESKNNFNPALKKSSIKLSGFYEVLAESKPLMVTNLITIDELNSFKEKNNDYLGYRVGDNLDSVNNETDNRLPATVTWFDVLAYINWLEKETKVAIRLLSLAEYKALREPESINSEKAVAASDLEFVDTHGNTFPEHPPYMAQEDFQKLTCRFGNSDRFRTSSGLDFIKSNSFAEWLVEETCIRSGNLKSFYNDDDIIRSKPPLESTGKYKGVKIGFRLCYELSNHQYTLN